MVMAAKTNNKNKNKKQLNLIHSKNQYLISSARISSSNFISQSVQHLSRQIVFFFFSVSLHKPSNRSIYVCRPANIRRTAPLTSSPPQAREVTEHRLQVDGWLVTVEIGKRHALRQKRFLMLFCGKIPGIFRFFFPAIGFPLAIQGICTGKFQYTQQQQRCLQHN
jgi:hypothetical protein